MDSKTLALIATIVAISSMVSMNSTDSTSQFESYKAKFGKAYTADEEAYRFAVYTANMQEISAHNAKGASYTKGENQFTDLTNDEFRSTYLMTIAPKRSDAEEAVYPEAVGSVNWVTKGGVQAVKDQGQCGSCWAFSTAAVTESWDFVQTGTLGDFSEQQLVSCDTADGNAGCGGGWPYLALDYYAAQGICTESSYPYTSGGGSSGSCKQSSCTMSSFKITGHKNIAKTSSAVQSANDASPVSVCVDASGWSSYSGGIFSDCTTSIDHAVLLAGYSGNSYWLIKNSWGASWGENGYIRLLGGADTCGVLDYAVIPQGG